MTAPAVPKKRRALRLLALQVVVLIGGLLLAEGVWRIVLRVRGTPYDSAAGAHELERQMSRARDFVPRLGPDAIGKPEDTRAQIRVTHPFLGWENLGGLEQLHLEATRLRSNEFDGDVEILTLGGSVAEMFGKYGVPHLEERLRADPRFASKRIYWYRYARGGFKQPQQVNMLTWLLGQGFTPDIVVNLDGFNEVALGMDNAKRGTSPLYPAITLWGNLAAGSIADRDALDAASRGRDLQLQAQTLAERALGWHVEWSALATTLVVRRLNGQRQAMNEAFDVYAAALKQRAEEGVLTGPPYGTDPGVVAQRSVTLWSECSRMSRAICESQGIFYLHVLQPTLHDPGAKPATSEELANGKAPDTWLEGVELGYPKLRNAGAQLAQGGEHFLDASGVFQGVERTIYIDSCHFLEDGNRILADAIADELLRRYP